MNLKRRIGATEFSIWTDTDFPTKQDFDFTVIYLGYDWCRRDGWISTWLEILGYSIGFSIGKVSDSDSE